MRYRSLLLPVLATVLLVAGSGSALLAQDEGLAVGARAPIVSAHDLNGATVDLGQWIGKRPVLLEFWATWCENCEALLPRMKAAAKRFGDTVEFIGVNVTVNQSRERVKRYAAEHQVPFRILYDDQGTSTRAYQAPVTSYVVIVDAQGNVVYTGTGPDQQFEPALERVAGGR